MPDRPEVELVILTFMPKSSDHSIQRSMYAPVSVLGALGDATGAAVDGSAVAARSGDTGGYTMAEVSNHDSKADCWIVVAGQVLNVTSFLLVHAGGIMMFKIEGSIAFESKRGLAVTGQVLNVIGCMFVHAGGAER